MPFEDLDVSPPTDEEETARFGAIAARSLGFPVDRFQTVVARVGTKNLRVARRGADVVGGLGVYAMGHWFGGRAVPCAGISMVAVAPEHRSRGIAAEMMRTVLEEARHAGVALSSLYPATFPVYRAAGYESAGNRFVYRLTLANLGPGAREPELREAGPADHATLRALYDARARTLSGPIDRTPFFWTRVLEPFGEDARAFVVEGPDGAEGYVVIGYRSTVSPLAPNEIPVRDVVARTPGAARRILRLLGDHRSIARYATFASGPGDPLLLVAREERLEMADLSRWMLRVVDVRAAFERRGWSPCVRGEIQLDLRDGLLRDNARRWVLEVDGGRAEVREGGSGALVLDPRGLAALYSGFLPAEELHAAGLCDGSAADLARASALFAGPAPWGADFF
ncbi:MAG TPA: GNAT family N-acetyltransferase [Polyangiaceae bacterium]|jgi:predicted acetyltransferase